MSAIHPLDYLGRRLAEANVSVSAPALDRVCAYFRLLAAWNRKINLTGFDLDHPSPAAIDRLLVEPLVAATYMTGPVTHIVDIGSGGGSPGIPLALALDSPRLTLVETKSRKVVFLKEALRAVHLVDAAVLTSRFETVAKDSGLECDALTARAVHLDGAALMYVAALVRGGGRAYLFRSDDSLALIRSLPQSLHHVETRDLLAGGSSSGSRVVILRKG